MTLQNNPLKNILCSMQVGRRVGPGRWQGTKPWERLFAYRFAIQANRTLKEKKQNQKKWEKMRNDFTWASVHLPQQKLRATGPHSWVPHTLPDCFCWDLLTVSAFQQQSWTQEGDAGQIIHWQFAGKKNPQHSKFCSVSSINWKSAQLSGDSDFKRHPPLGKQELLWMIVQ